jgi:hypothetical protein
VNILRSLVRKYWWLIFPDLVVLILCGAVIKSAPKVPNPLTGATVPFREHYSVVYITPSVAHVFYFTFFFGFILLALTVYFKRTEVDP